MPAGLVCHMLVRYDDDTTAEADVRSRKTSSVVRCASVSVKPRWVGQDRQDLTGVGVCVGPDGLQDARLHLSGLSPRFAIKSIRVETSAGVGWEFGLNPQLLNNAEFVKDAKDPQQGDFFFQPDRDLSGARLRLSVAYEGNVPPDGVAVAGGRCDAKLRMPQAPLPKVEELTLITKWLGQDGSNPARPGDVHVVLGGLPGSARIVAIAMSDTVREAWQYRARAIGCRRSPTAARHPRRPVPPRSQDGRPVCLALPRHQSGDLLQCAWSRTAGPGMASSPAAPAT